MKVSKKNPIKSSIDLHQIKVLPILHAIYPVDEAYKNVPFRETSHEYFIIERHELRHARRELLNIFHALTDLS